MSLCTSAPGLPGSAPGRVSEVQLLHSPTTKSFAPNLPGLELSRVSDVRLRDTGAGRGSSPWVSPLSGPWGRPSGGKGNPRGLIAGGQPANPPVFWTLKLSCEPPGGASEVAAAWLESGQRGAGGGPPTAPLPPRPYGCLHFAYPARHGGGGGVRTALTRPGTGVGGGCPHSAYPARHGGWGGDRSSRQPGPSRGDSTGRCFAHPYPLPP